MSTATMGRHARHNAQAQPKPRLRLRWSWPPLRRAVTQTTEPVEAGSAGAAAAAPEQETWASQHPFPDLDEAVISDGWTSWAPPYPPAGAQFTGSTVLDGAPLQADWEMTATDLPAVLPAPQPVAASDPFASVITADSGPAPVATLSIEPPAAPTAREPLAFLRRAVQGGELWQLSGEPVFRGLKPCGDSQVGEVGLGIAPGFPALLAGEKTYMLRVALACLEAVAAFDAEEQESAPDAAEAEAPEGGAAA